MVKYSYKEFQTFKITEKDIQTAVKNFNAQSKYRILKMAQLFSRRLNEYKVTNCEKPKNPLLMGALAAKNDFGNIQDLKQTLRSHDELAGIETILGTVNEEISEVYGWTRVMSKSHTFLSEIDCSKMINESAVSLICMKSGPYCINDTMANKIGSSIASHCIDWANKWNAKKLEFTVGVAYSTPKKSNKKNWHAIRIAEEELRNSGAQILKSCVEGKQAKKSFYAKHGDIQLVVRTAQGIELWDLISRPEKNAYLEICCALSKCVRDNKRDGHNSIKDWVKLFAEGFANVEEAA